MVGSLEPRSAGSHINDDLQKKVNEPMWFLILKLGKKLFEKATSWAI